MKVVVLNGSPKGANSVTMQYMAYLEKLYTQHNFVYVHAAWKIAQYEKDEALFQEAIEECRSADIILWSFPLYFLLVSSRYKQFIELIFDRGAEDAFKGKHTGAFSTSIHFYDNTAHDYIQGVAQDLGMEYVDFFSAEMSDLMKAENRKSLCAWFNRIVEAAENRMVIPKLFAALPEKIKKLPALDPLPDVSSSRKVTVVCDNTYNNSNLKNMVESLRSGLAAHNYVDLSEIKMGPCTGCCKCGLDNICAYQDSSDEYISMYTDKVLPADILIFALDMRDRYFGYNFQRYLERSFVRTHQPTLWGKKIILLVSGPLSMNFAAYNTLKSYFDVNRATLVSTITDESGDAQQIRQSIQEAVQRADLWSQNNIARPQTFPGIGGMKIFRDDIFKGLNMVFQADHKYYKKHGIYDFPHGHIGMRIACFFGRIVTRIPFIRKKFRSMMTKGMIMPYQRILQKAHLEKDFAK